MITTFLAGAITFSFVLAGLFFARFWRDTREELFLCFSIAFGLLAVAQLVLELADVPNEQRAWVFLIRLAAFSLILLAIFRKNRG
jgi:hypothetical protein